MDATPPPRVIMMCPAITDAGVFAGWMAGAAGCLTIDGAVEDLVRTVRANSRGEMFHIRSVSESALRFAQYRPRYVDISLLTDRQKQVMGLVADGFNNGAIAAVLGLTSYTARNYMNSVLGKLGIASRAEIAGTRLTPRGAENGQRRGREPAVFGWLVGHLTSAEHLQRDVESVNGGGKTYHWDVEVQGKYPVKCSA